MTRGRWPPAAIPPRATGHPRRMGRDDEAERVAGSGCVIERHHAVRRRARQHRARALVAKPAARKRRGRADRRHAEARHQERMPEAGRPEQRRHQFRRAIREGGNQVPVRPRILAAQRLRRGVDRTLDDDRGPIVERMREGGLRLSELEAVRRERQRFQERREHHQRVHGGADIMNESRPGQLQRARGAADRRLGFEDAHRAARARQRDGRGQAVRAGADHDRVERQRLKGRSWIQLNCRPRLTSRNLLRSNSRASMWMVVAVERAVENQPLRVGLLELEGPRRQGPAPAVTAIVFAAMSILAP